MCKQIVFFHIGGGNFAGGSRMLLRLIRSLDRNRFSPVILSQVDDELCQRARTADIEVTITPFKGVLDTYDRRLLNNKASLPFVAPRIAQFNYKIFPCLYNADIIWCQNLRAVLTLFPYLTCARTPSVWNIGLGINAEGAVEYLHRIALRTVDHVFIESEEQATRVFTDCRFERYRSKFTIFHKGIDTKKFDSSKFEKNEDAMIAKIGTAASITPRKGIDYLIDALPAVLETHDVRLRIAGKSPDGVDQYRQQLQQRISTLGIEEYVEFLGWVEDMPQFLNSLDVFVLPSLNEGIPGSVREALAMEVPVIATDVGGTTDIVIDGETGYLVPPENSNIISDRIIRLLNNKEQAMKMGAKGRAHVQTEFSIESYVTNYENFFEDIV